MRPHRLAVRTPAFQAGDTGSIPVGDAILRPRFPGSTDDRRFGSEGGSSIREFGLERDAKGLDRLAPCIFAHEAHSPDLPREFAQPAAHLDGVTLE